MKIRNNVTLGKFVMSLHLAQTPSWLIGMREPARVRLLPYHVEIRILSTSSVTR